MLQSGLTRMLTYRNIPNFTYFEIQSKSNLLEKLYQAFSKDGSGVLTISEVPRLASVRQNLYQQSFQLAQLPQAEKLRLLSPASGYKIGWNEQKTPFGEIQASFTANPQEDTFSNPPYSNLWPSQFPYFRSNFRVLGQILLETTIHLSTHIDHFLDMHFPYSQLPRFESTISSSSCHLSHLSQSLPFHQSSLKSMEKPWDLSSNIFSVFISPIYHQHFSNEEEEQIITVKGNDAEETVLINNDSICICIGKTAEKLSDGLFEAKPYLEVYDEKYKGMIRTNYFTQVIEDDLRVAVKSNQKKVGRVFARYT